MKNRSGYWYLRLLTLITLILYFIGSYFTGWLDLLSLIVLFPVFICCISVIYLSLLDSPKKQILSYKFIGAMFATSIFLAFTLAFLSLILLPIKLDKSILLDREKYSYCAWLTNVPNNWHCQDNWDDSTRYLTAYNPANKDEYLQLQIEGNHPLHNDCLNLYPAIPRFFMPSASGITVPMRCVDNGEMLYRADWDQDNRHFRLIGKQIDLGLFLSNLDMHHGGMNRGGSYTTNDVYSLTPTSFSTTGKRYEIDMYLTKTNLCRDDNTLKEQIYLSLDGTYPIDIVEIKTDPECVIQLRLRIHNLKPGTYPVISTVNGLTQQLKDKITLE